MSLERVLLGLLREPASGYDLGKEFEAAAAHFWSAHLSQIYPTLKRMERRGWLTSSTESSDRGPDRRVYRRTSEGARELEEWLRAEPEGRESRVPYLAQLFFLGQVAEPDVTVQFLSSLRETFRERLRALEEIEEEWAADDPRFPDRLPPDAFHQMLTLRAGLAVFRARVAWCEESLHLLERRSAADPAAASTS